MGEAVEADPAVLVGVIGDCRTEDSIPHTVACRALGVLTTWYDKWRKRPANPTKHEVSRAALTKRVKELFEAPGGTYGSPRITPDLWAEGRRVSRNAVAGIMTENGWYGR